MNSFKWRRLSRAVLGGFLIGSSLIGYAQDQSTPGIVRITDSRPNSVPVQTVGFGHHHRNDCPDCYGYSGGCPNCYGGGCPNCNGGGCPYCNDGCHGHHCFLKGHFREHYCSHAADHGYSLPAKYPIHRRGVQYTSYFPAAWYGTPGGGLRGDVTYPMVYQPTDTTQLGYYYQHVPFWMPNPNALPPRPIPAQWHNLHSSRYGGNCPVQGAVWVDAGSSTTTPTPMPATEPAPQPNLIPGAPSLESAPAPPPPSDQNSLIRRAGMQQY